MLFSAFCTNFKVHLKSKSRITLHYGRKLDNGHIWPDTLQQGSKAFVRCREIYGERVHWRASGEKMRGGGEDELTKGGMLGGRPRKKGWETAKACWAQNSQIIPDNSTNNSHTNLFSVWLPSPHKDAEMFWSLIKHRILNNPLWIQIASFGHQSKNARHNEERGGVDARLIAAYAARTYVGRFRPCRIQRISPGGKISSKIRMLRGQTDA